MPRRKNSIYAIGLFCVGRGMRNGVVRDHISSHATGEGRKDDEERIVDIALRPRDWRFLLAYIANRPVQFESAIRAIVRVWDEADDAEGLARNPARKPWRERHAPLGFDSRLASKYLREAMPDEGDSANG